jgi:hypothetical protein
VGPSPKKDVRARRLGGASEQTWMGLFSVRCSGALPPTRLGRRFNDRIVERAGDRRVREIFI